MKAKMKSNSMTCRASRDLVRQLADNPCTQKATLHQATQEALMSLDRLESQ